MSQFDGFNRRYQAELTEEIQSVEVVLLAGNITDFVEYKRLVAKRLAFMQALNRHKELITLMEQANDK